MYSTENCAARRPIAGNTGRRLCGISDEEDTLQPSALATCRATILLHLRVAAAVRVARAEVRAGVRQARRLRRGGRRALSAGLRALVPYKLPVAEVLVLLALLRPPRILAWSRRR